MSYISGHEGVEAQLLDWNAELGKLALVGLDHVGVGLADLLELCLDLLDSLVLEVLYLL
jgi:hypothetical protein